MKKLFLFLVITFISEIGFSQNRKPSSPDIMYYEKTNFLSYAGEMNDEVFSYLSKEEIVLYDSCLTILGLTRESVKWYTSELLDSLMSKKCKYSIKSVSLKTDPSLSWVHTWPGKDELKQPQCLFVVTRMPNKVDEIAIHMYY